MARIILGLAPGRCGSASLADLLRRQRGVWATHTCPVYPISDDPPTGLLDLSRRAKEAGCHTAAVVGPQWIKHADAAFEEDGRTIGLILFRTPDRIVQSMRDTGWWGQVVERGCQDVPGRSPSEYVANYYLHCLALAALYPTRIRVVDCDSLSRESHNILLLDWCFIEATDPSGVHLNDAASCCARKETHAAAAG